MRILRHAMYTLFVGDNPNLVGANSHAFLQHVTRQNAKSAIISRLLYDRLLVNLQIQVILMSFVGSNKMMCYSYGNQSGSGSNEYLLSTTSVPAFQLIVQRNIYRVFPLSS